ncbi:MAG: hypothetical protein DIU56_015720 [Pseudomonadota bacterium]|jgi:hypothetical protein|nr:MAG: hypothetical protein DIU56_13360 [Pseudomonadota bacterium]
MTTSTFFEWLESTPVSVAIAQSSWLFPAIEAVHVLALTAVVGSIAMVDLRLLSLWSSGVPAGRLVRSLLPVTWVAFAVAVVSGLVLFATGATVYLANEPFRYKLLLILLAGVNMLVFHALAGQRLNSWQAGATPLFARFAGGLSLLFWTGVVFLGRWIAFV